MVMGRSPSCSFPATPRGQQAVFLRLGQRRVFLIGDVAVTLEAAERGQFLVQVQACVAPNYCTVGFCQPPGGVTFLSTSRGPQLPGS
jgi:hypothetical protein